LGTGASWKTGFPCNVSCARAAGQLATDSAQIVANFLLIMALS
jgi:hypothetical protein